MRFSIVMLLTFVMLVLTIFGFMVAATDVWAGCIGLLVNFFCYGFLCALLLAPVRRRT